MLVKNDDNLLAVQCDRCSRNRIVLPQGFYSIVQFLANNGWEFDGDKHTCKGCSKEIEGE